MAGWWIPIGLLVVLVPVLAVLALLSPPDVVTAWPATVLSLLALALALLSPAFVYLDRRYVEAVSPWRPSGWYYWMFLPLVSIALAVAYVYQRHRYVGTP